MIMTEKEYIEREALEKFVSSVRHNLPLESPDFITRDYMLLNFEQYIHLMPAADVAPVRYGCWVNESFYTHCSVCGNMAIYDKYGQEVESDYCPNCGAKMDGENL